MQQPCDLQDAPAAPTAAEAHYHGRQAHPGAVHLPLRGGQPQHQEHEHRPVHQAHCGAGGRQGTVQGPGPQPGGRGAVPGHLLLRLLPVQGVPQHHRLPAPQLSRRARLLRLLCRFRGVLRDQPHLVREDEAAAGPQCRRPPHDRHAGHEEGLQNHGY